jgi:hypothetical protein
MIQTFSLAAALTAVGDAEVFSGDPWTSGGMTSLGAKEGDVSDTAGSGWLENILTAIEHTGDTPHQVRVTAGRAEFTIGIIAGQTGLLARISPTGSEDGPPERSTKVTETGVFLAPRALFDTAPAGITYNGTVWTPSGIDTDPSMANCLFFPRAYFKPGAMPRPYGSGGKGVIPVTVTGMYYGAGPTGKRTWCRGNPVTKGYTLFRL